VHYTISRLTILNLTTSPYHSLHSGSGEAPCQTVHFTSSCSLHCTRKNCTHKLTWETLSPRTDVAYVLTTNRQDRIWNSKTKPNHPFDLWQYSTPIQFRRCSRTRRHPWLATPPCKRSHLLESWFTSVLSMLTTHTGKV